MPCNLCVGQILVQRLKVPPSINQFSKTLDKNQATELLKLLMKYQPEDKKAKQQRLKEIAAAKEAGKNPAPSKAPKVCKRLLDARVWLLDVVWCILAGCVSALAVYLLYI